MKKVYDTTKLLCGQKNTQSKPIKDKNGTVLTNVDQPLKGALQEVLNRPPPAIQTDLPEVPPLAIRTGPTTRAEVKNALKTQAWKKRVDFRRSPVYSIE